MARVSGDLIEYALVALPRTGTPVLEGLQRTADSGWRDVLVLVCGMLRNAECGMRNVECGMWNAECGVADGCTTCG